MSQSFAEALSWLPKSRSLATTLERAFELAKAQNHSVVALEHLVTALVSDSDASAVLQACQIDLNRLNHDVTGYLAGLGNQAVGGPGVEPVAAPELLRILEYAAAAAQQSRRREINGAIVLAAIVGDGRSPAAAMLRGQGLTFEEAVKALQRVNVAQRPAPQPAPQPAPARAPQPAPQPYAPPQEAASPPPQHVPQPHPAPVAKPRPAGPPPGWHGEQSDPRTQLPPRYANGQPVGVTEELLARARQRVETGRKPAPETNEPPQQPAPPHPADMAANAPPDDFSDELPRHQDAEPQSDWPDRHVEEAAAETAMEQARYEDDHAPAAPPMPPPEPPWAQRAPAPPVSRSVDDPYADDDYLRRRSQTAPPPPPGDDSYRHQPPHAPPAGYRPEPPSGMPPQRPVPAPWPSAPPPGYPDGPPVAARAPQHAPAGATAKTGGQGAKKRGAPLAAGQLVENVPRTMRVGRSETVEVRIAKEDVSALAEGLQGTGTAYRHDIVVTRAMSVRLRAPEGGFWVETASPETQWIENALGSLSDDYASWRWHVTPQRAGKARLQLVVSARTVGSDGLVAETALPDRVINVKVRINYTQSASHWGGWILAAVIGGVLARFGEGVWDFLQALLGGTGS